MSGGYICKCGEHAKPMAERMWRVIDYRCNYSKFSGSHYTPSAYSALTCLVCHSTWRTKAPYVETITHISHDEKQKWLGVKT